MSYRSLTRTYHPDKWSNKKEFLQNEEIEKFKLIVNVREFLLKQTNSNEYDDNDLLVR